MILKMLFKATIPMVIIGGVMSYGMYTRGGDPAGLMRLILGNSIQSAKLKIQGAGDTLESVSPMAAKSSKTTVYQWVDENGTTQFGSAPPEGIAATAKTYDNNANLMAATPVQKRPDPSQVQTGVGPDDMPMPGMAGMDLPVAVDPAMLSEIMEGMQLQQDQRMQQALQEAQ